MSDAAGPGLRVALITHNVCTLFDELLKGTGALEKWVGDYSALLPANADFVALHMQEVGGLNWKKGGVDEAASQVVVALAAALPDFWCSGLLHDADVSVPDAFSALGCVYLVRRSRLAEVQVWRFGTGIEPGAFVQLDASASLCGALLSAPALPRAHCRHFRYPAAFTGTNVGRKGYLHTRWRLRGAPVDLLNIHLFHDESNLDALRREPADSLSCYARSRQLALRHALDAVSAARAAAVDAPGSPAPALFAFGDFNFRLDQAALVSRLCGEAALETLLASPPDDSTPASLPVTPPAADAAAGEAGRALAVGNKHFAFSWPGAVRELDPLLREADVEVSSLAALNGLALRELTPPPFAPTYNREPSDAEPSGFRYSEKRCPAWTDRVLMDAGGWELARTAPTAPSYSIPQHSALNCDHEKVVLTFDA